MTLAQQQDLELPESVYTQYVYSYPHKTAYRDFARPLQLHQIWEQEDRGALFLYAHIPFCEFRCGFCNLFTQSQPNAALPEAYIAQLRRETRTVAEQLGDTRYARLAVGGGTPTYLTESQLEALFSILQDELGCSVPSVPAGIECSPATITESKLRVLRDAGINRLSMGVQSLSKRETNALGRPQERAMTEKALDSIRHVGFESLNVDLIYGGDGQTPDSFVDSIRAALHWQPEEVFLYPLYIRPLTGLGKLTGKQNAATENQGFLSSSLTNSKGSVPSDKLHWDERRLACYRAGRDFLREHGYQQFSMRSFRLTSVAWPAESSVRYSCQADGMVGIGCGARSYSSKVHYSLQYAVEKKAVAAIVQEYLQLPSRNFQATQRGFELDQEERQRRFLLLSLFNTEGLSDGLFADAYGCSAAEVFPQLHWLEASELATFQQGSWQLTEAGLELSDQLGPAFFSEEVRRKMGTYQCI